MSKSENVSGWLSMEAFQANSDMQKEETFNKDEEYTRSPDRDTDSNRNRSRSRDVRRSWSPRRDISRARSRSRSPKRSGPPMTSKPCRDFAAGKCRRGSQCRFSHQDNNLNYRDSGRSESDHLDGRGRSRAGHGGGSRYYHNKGSADTDRYGKYPRHNTAGDNYYDKGNRSGRSHDDKWGCNSDDKNISWDDSKGDSDRGIPDTAKATAWEEDNKKSWGGCAWDDVAASSDVPKASGWGESAVTKNTQNPTTADMRNDDKQRHTLENEKKARGGPARNERATKRDKFSGRSRADRWGPRDAAAGLPDTAKVAGREEATKNSWDGPTWDDVAAGSLDRLKATGWGGPTEKQNDDILGHSFETKRKERASQGWNDKAAEGDENLSSLGWNGNNNGANKGTTEFGNLKMSVSREESQFYAQGSESQTLSGNIVQPKMLDDSYVLPHVRQAVDSMEFGDGFDAVNQLQVSGNDNVLGDNFGSSMPKRQEPVANPEGDGGNKIVEKVDRNNGQPGEKCKQEQKNITIGNVDANSKVEEDEKAILEFKTALVDFVKEVLKPVWKQGRMSKEVHKTIVKKVVDKVTTIEGVNIPKTRELINQYMAVSSLKISKLVKGYEEMYLKGG